MVFKIKNIIAFNVSTCCIYIYIYICIGSVIINAQCQLHENIAYHLHLNILVANFLYRTH